MTGYTLAASNGNCDAQRVNPRTSSRVKGYGDYLDETATEGSYRLWYCKRGPYTARSAAESSVIIDKDGFPIAVSFDRVIKMPRRLSKAEPTVRLLNTASQPKTGLEENIEETRRLRHA